MSVQEFTPMSDRADQQLQLAAVTRLQRHAGGSIEWSAQRAIRKAGLDEAAALRYEPDVEGNRVVAVGLEESQSVRKRPRLVSLREGRVAIPREAVAALGFDPDSINGEANVEIYAGGDGVLVFEPARTTTVDGDVVADLQATSDNPLDRLPPATREDFVGVKLQGHGTAAWADRQGKSQSTVSVNANRGVDILEEAGVDIDELRERYEAGDIQ